MWDRITHSSTVMRVTIPALLKSGISWTSTRLKFLAESDMRMINHRNILPSSSTARLLSHRHCELNGGRTRMPHNI